MNIVIQQDIDKKITAALNNAETQNEGFKLLMDTYQERLYWHIRRMVTDHEDANDVIQNCLVKVFRSFHNFKGDAQLYTWLYRIATNECLTFLKKKKKHQSEELDFHAMKKELQADPFFDGDDIQSSHRRNHWHFCRWIKSLLSLGCQKSGNFCKAKRITNNGKRKYKKGTERDCPEAQ